MTEGAKDASEYGTKNDFLKMIKIIMNPSIFDRNSLKVGGGLFQVRPLCPDILNACSATRREILITRHYGALRAPRSGSRGSLTHFKIRFSGF